MLGPVRKVLNVSSIRSVTSSITLQLIILYVLYKNKNFLCISTSNLLTHLNVGIFLLKSSTRQAERYKFYGCYKLNANKYLIYFGAVKKTCLISVAFYLRELTAQLREKIDRNCGISF